MIGIGGIGGNLGSLVIPSSLSQWFAEFSEVRATPGHNLT